jgi:hypothetical protein
VVGEVGGGERAAEPGEPGHDRARVEGAPVVPDRGQGGGEGGLVQDLAWPDAVEQQGGQTAVGAYDVGASRERSCQPRADRDPPPCQRDRRGEQRVERQAGAEPVHGGPARHHSRHSHGQRAAWRHPLPRRPQRGDVEFPGRGADREHRAGRPAGRPDQRDEVAPDRALVRVDHRQGRCGGDRGIEGIAPAVGDRPRGVHAGGVRRRDREAWHRGQSRSIRIALAKEASASASFAGRHTSS